VAVAARTLRIGELARLAGTTPRTVRYYEEIGLLPEAGAREIGAHRVYTESDLERLREILRLKHLLGLSLDELKVIVAAEAARAALRAEFRTTEDRAERRRILAEGLGHLDDQLALVRRRLGELQALERELSDRRTRNRMKMAELEAAP
jgi:MerR family transcriptional regulator, repressor of the yfmOP operon